MHQFISDSFLIIKDFNNLKHTIDNTFINYERKKFQLLLSQFNNFKNIYQNIKLNKFEQQQFSDFLKVIKQIQEIKERPYSLKEIIKNKIFKNSIISFKREDLKKINNIISSYTSKYQ